MVRVAGWNATDVSAEASVVLALELYRQDKVSLGRSAELCDQPIERFMELAAEHNIPQHYGLTDLEEDRETLKRLGL